MRINILAVIGVGTTPTKLIMTKPMMNNATTTATDTQREKVDGDNNNNNEIIIFKQQTHKPLNISSNSNIYWYDLHDRDDGEDVNIKEDINKDIVIQMRTSRRDRLASNIERPLFLMSYAHCYRQSFCIVDGRFGLAKYFPGFVNKTCPEGIEKKLGWGDKGWKDKPKPMFDEAPMTKTGVYPFMRADGYLHDWFHEHEECAFDDAMRRRWGEMIVEASLSDNPEIVNTTLAKQNLFEKINDPNIITVAINIRRGDLGEWKKHVVHDQFYVILLRQLRSILVKAGKSPEVHLFSEDYGLIDSERNITRNWTMYNGLVEHFHLAPDMRTKKNPHAMDLDLNLRDWRHFIKADILVEGSHFSVIPGFGRPQHPDPKTGLPLTIHMGSKINNSNETVYTYGYSKYDYGFMPDKFKLQSLPNVFAKHDTIPVEFFMKDLLADWNTTYNRQ